MKCYINCLPWQRTVADLINSKIRSTVLPFVQLHTSVNILAMTLGIAKKELIHTQGNLGLILDPLAFVGYVKKKWNSAVL